MAIPKQELYMTAYRFKEQEDARYEEDKKTVVKLFIKHKQEDLLPMLGLEVNND
jgi:hypothetical protein